MRNMKRLLLLILLCVPASASAQSATVTTNAPIYVAAVETQTPLRVAAAGTKLDILQDTGEWLQVAFNDPQYGRRVGWVKRSYLRVADPALQPMDLSVNKPSVTQPPVEQQAAPVIPHHKEQMPVFKQHVVARTGGTFGTAPAALVGVEMSGDVLPVLQVYGSFDYHWDVLPTYVQDFADAVSEPGLVITAKVPAYVGMGGVKVIAPPSLPVRPYGLGGFGIGHGHTVIRLNGEDITDDAAILSGTNPDDLKFTKPMFEVGGGVAIPVGHFYIDASYRFRKALASEDINISGFYIGAGGSF